MAGLLGGREESQGLLGDPRKLQALLGYEGMPTPDAAEGMPQYDPESLKRLGTALATMPTVQAVKEMVQYPAQVARGEKQVPQTYGPEAGSAGDAPVEWAVGNSVLPGVAMAFGPAVAARAGEQVLGSGPIRAYHGSPHDFDRFDLSKIGTGEGAQAYGHGLYMAESEAVAKGYRDRLSPRDTYATEELVKEYRMTPGQINDAMRNWERYIQSANVYDKRAMTEQIARKVANGGSDFDRLSLDILEGRLPISARSSGRMYEVAIHANPERFLDWDKPLSGQSEGVREAYRGIRGFSPEDMQQFDPGRSGMNLYNDIGLATRKPEMQQAATDALREAGIPGIKYLDAGSRNYHPASLPDNPIANEARQFLDAAGGDSKAALKLFSESNPVERFGQGERDEVRKVIQAAANQQTRNYVLFDDKIVEILRKYGVASIAALPPAVQAAIQLSQEQQPPSQ